VGARNHGSGGLLRADVCFVLNQTVQRFYACNSLFFILFSDYEIFVNKKNTPVNVTTARDTQLKK